MRITDFSLINEVKNEYICLRQDGVSRIAAVDQLMENYHNELTIGKEDDAHLFWVGVADGQYAIKELSAEVASKALNSIQCIAQQVDDIAQVDIKRRVQWYLSGEQPERKCVKKPVKFRCTWNVGDTFAYQLSGQEAEALDLSGKYMILRKVDSIEFGDGRLLPIVTFSLWDHLPLPKTDTELADAGMLRLSWGRFEYPDTMYEYRAEILFRNYAQVRRMGLEFVGNFPNIQMPADEVVLNHPAKLLMVSPDRFDKDCSIYWKMHNYVTK